MNVVVCGCYCLRFKTIDGIHLGHKIDLCSCELVLVCNGLVRVHSETAVPQCSIVRKGLDFESTKGEINCLFWIFVVL